MSTGTKARKAVKDTTGKGTKGKGTTAEGFTADERAAMKERVLELKASARRGSGESAADAERTVLAKIDAMAEPDRSMGRRLHAIIMASAPALVPRLWYGMPAYASDGDVVCFYQGSRKFKTRYSTLGFSDKAQLDDGDLWATAYALPTLTSATEKRIGALVKKACGVE